MKPKDYIKHVKKTDSTYVNVADRLSQDTNKIRLINCALGIAGEAGEVVDIIKKHITYDQPLDKQKIIMEVGDVLWYTALLLSALDSSLEEAMQVNIDKLKKRFPNGFTEKDAKDNR